MIPQEVDTIVFCTFYLLGDKPYQHLISIAHSCLAEYLMLAELNRLSLYLRDPIQNKYR
jgi:hypothetical protein